MEPGRRRRPGRRIRPEPLRRQAGLVLSGAGQYSLPTINWVRFPGGDDDLPDGEPSPAWPLDAVLDGVARAGSPAVGLDHYTVQSYLEAGGRVDDLAAMLRSRRLVCTDAGILPIGEDNVVAAAEAVAHVAAVTGARICIAAVYGPTARPDAMRDLRACADILADAGARLALEFASYGGLTALSEAIALCDAVGWERCGLLVDTWHFFRTGQPWAQLRSLDRDQLAMLHVNDGPPPSGADPVFEGRFRRLPVGAGTFPIDQFAGAVAAIGFRGVVSTEVLSTRLRRLPPEDGARELVESLQAYWPA